MTGSSKITWACVLRLTHRGPAKLADKQAHFP